MENNGYASCILPYFVLYDINMRELGLAIFSYDQTSVTEWFEML